nr:transmembrane protein 254 isoform X2 [Pongo abelii]
MGAGTAGELPANSVSGFFKRMVKSEASNAATAYFRPARPLPSLVTVLGLGYFAVRRGAGRASVLARRALVGRGELWERGLCARASDGCLGYSLGCLLASEYPLSEPWAPGPLHSVLGGPPSHPPVQWVLACLADSCGRVLVCHSIVQVSL